MLVQRSAIAIDRDRADTPASDQAVSYRTPGEAPSACNTARLHSRMKKSGRLSPDHHHSERHQRYATSARRVFSSSTKYAQYL